MGSLFATRYSLSTRKIATWNQQQEKLISTEYPFDVLPLNGPDDLAALIARIYLEFLWLPESLMPLRLLIPSLSRIAKCATTSQDAAHLSHEHLAPILLSPGAVSSKYQTELPRILINGGGAGEMEETMMWYSVTHERGNGIDEKNPNDEEEGIWADEKWRSQYLERMERREVQIQILLYLYKLTLPGPSSLSMSESPKKRKRSSRKVQDQPTLSTEDYLESFMDKLSMWQLIRGLETSRPSVESGDRDWIQLFAEDIVERQFKHGLPEVCELLRSKVFPNSPFGDSDTESNASAAAEPVQRNKKSLARVPSTSASSSRALSRAPSTSRITSPAHESTSSRLQPSRAQSLVRSRSRSLSVSLAQEQEDRERAAADAQSKKRFMNREVSMSRVFKPKAKGRADAGKPAKIEAPPASKAKPKRTVGVTLVEETPVKPKAKQKAGSLRFGQAQGSLTRNFSFCVKDITVNPRSNPTQDDDNDEEWMMDSSPDIVLLNPQAAARGSSRSRSGSIGSAAGQDSSIVKPKGDVDDDSDDELGAMAVDLTPSRPSRRKR